jgi:hypothetical protein
LSACRVLGDLGALTNAVPVRVGDRLGFYEALAKTGRWVRQRFRGKPVRRKFDAGWNPGCDPRPPNAILYLRQRVSRLC